MTLLLVVAFLSACQNLSTKNQNLSYKLSQKYGKYIRIYKNGSLIGTINPKYKEEIDSIASLKNEAVVVVPVYSSLLNYSSDRYKQPFTDLTGNGKPDFICFDKQIFLTNSSSAPQVFRLFEIDNGKLKELSHFKAEFGEILYFKDFNNDGVPEIVTSDGSRKFLYSKKGYPISSYVWIYDQALKKYWNAASMIGSLK
jgi:hypothetical protein